MKKYIQKVQIWKINKKDLRIKMMNVQEDVIMRKTNGTKKSNPRVSKRKKGGSGKTST